MRVLTILRLCMNSELKENKYQINILVFHFGDYFPSKSRNKS